MDGRRRGGGRSGSLGRKGSGGRGTYRRVQAPTTEDSGPDTHRSVQVVDGGDDGASPAPFQSSLRSSLKDSMRQEPPPSKRKDNSDRKSPNNKDLQVQTKTQRQVISLSSPSPQKGAGQTKKFVSSLTKSMRDEDRGSRQDRGEKGGKGVKGSSLRRSSSRDPPRRSSSREPMRRSNSREPRQWSGEGQGYRSGNRSVSRTRLTRKNSSDSVSSQRSDRSDRSFRNERYSEEYRSSLNDGPAPVRRLSSGSSLLTKSSQDVRVQKKRPVSGTIGRSIGRPAQDTSSRRSSLDGGASSLRRVNSISPVGSSGGRLSSQDARFAGASNSQRSPSGASGLRNNAPGGDSISPKVEKSTVAQEKEDTSVKDTAPAVIDEAERKRRADTLQKRMEARKLERGSSLAQMMKAPVDRKNSMEDDAQQSPFGSRKELENGRAPSTSDADKEARTREYYAKLDKENAEREAAARTTSFKSSLTSSIGSGPAKIQSSLSASIDAAPPRTLKASIAASMEARPVRTLKSSLAASLTSSRQTVARAKKLQYSLAELRRIMEFALPRPKDLPDMKIVEVTQIRDPSSVTKRAGRLGAGYGIGRSIGGSIRKDDRSGGRGARSQGSLRDGRRDRPGRGGRGGGRGGRGGGGGRGYGRPPPPPLYDGPIEPLVVTENRWKPAKEKDVSGLEKTLNHVKSLLNKLTREKFAKLTNELCSVDIDSFVLLSSIVSIIMDKALEEPSFADVYADLCKEFHARTAKKTWNFLSILSDEKGSFYWTAIDKITFTSFAGPFESPHSCLEDAEAPESSAMSVYDSESIASVNFRRHGDYLVAVGEKEAGVFYYSKRKISDIGGDEPFGGPFETAEAAHHAATTQVTFTRLLVNRCQGEFEKTNKHVGQLEEKKEEVEIDPRRREILAMRAKAKMLGNIRFIGELYKVDLIKQSGVQGCIFYLLGLELIPGDEGQEAQAQAARFPDEQDLEALCKMLATAGKKFDQPKTKRIMKIIILRMVELSDDTKLPSRARFLVKDVLETRDHMWEPRRKEMQQKTLEEVRREAQKLQQQGKNAQHDDVKRRRHKTRISSAQLAKQSSNLIVAKKEEPDEPEHDEAQELSPAQVSTRIKSIIQEYISIVDLDEATTCVQELPMDPYHVEFAEQTINTALEGKTSEREHAVELLVGLYERGALDANSIQAALVNVMEFLEDMKIDLPLIHQYSALIFGRLVAAGCFGFSWIISEALAHCVECKLTSLVFPEILSVLELESDERTVIRMLTDEEVTAESVLPSAMRNETDVEAYLRENGIESFFDEEEDELDEEAAGKMRSTLEEYLTVKDFDEVVLCMQELDVPDRWRHFVHIMLAFGLEEKQSIRKDVAGLLLQLITSEKITSEDIEAAVDIILVDYDDLRVDIPQLAVNLSELWTPLFTKEALTVQWLSEVCSHLVESGRAADVLDALLSAIQTQDGPEALKAWWTKQTDANAIWTQMSPAREDGNPKDERLTKWKEMLQQ